MGDPAHKAHSVVKDGGRNEVEEREELVGLMSEMAEAEIADVTAEAEMAEADRGRLKEEVHVHGSWSRAPAARPVARKAGESKVAKHGLPRGRACAGC